MKKKNDDSEIITRKILKEELSLFNSRLQRKFEEIDEKAKEYRDDILTRLDDVMGKFEAFREDAEIGVYQTRELREELDDHEKRIRRLEKPQTPA